MQFSKLAFVAAIAAAPQAIAQVETQVITVTTNGPSTNPFDFFEFFLTPLDAPCAPTMTDCFGQPLFYASGLIDCSNLDAAGLAAAMGAATGAPGVTISVTGNVMTIDVDTAVTGMSLFACINMIECPFPFGYGIGGTGGCSVNNICSGICGDEADPPGASGFNLTVMPELGSNYCTTSPNSVSSGALISAFGSTSVANQDLCLVGSSAPDNFGLFFYSPVQAALPFGDGTLCIAGSIQRFAPQPITSNMIVLDVDFGSAAAADILAAGAASQTLNFQLWFRDPGGPGGSGFNTSDALEIFFQP